MTPQTNLEHALAYAAQGWRIIPCHTPLVDAEGRVRCSCHKGAACPSPGKHPRTMKGETMHGLTDATTDADTIRKWWTMWPAANIGALPGSVGLIAFDIDTPEHEAKGRALGLYAEPTREAITPNGVHRYFRHTETLHNGATLEGIIVRKSFGLTILPPSLGRNKTTGELAPYRWSDYEGFADVPPLVAERLRVGASAEGARERVQHAMSAERWTAGDRHPNLLALAGSYAARRMPLEHALEALLALNATKCDPPKERDEVERLVRDVYAKEAAKAVTFDAPVHDAPPMEWAPIPEMPPELAPQGAPFASTPVRPLSGFLSALEGVRSPDAAGGVPIPDAWECVRAILGRVDRHALEHEYGSEAVLRASLKGTHLPAGLHIITGQTGGGKSALVTNMALAAAKAGHPVLYVSLELDGAEIAARVLALECDVAWYKLAHWEPLEPGEQQARQHATETLTTMGVPERFAVYAPLGGFTPGRLWGEVRTLWQQHGKVPLVVLDYLQLSTVMAGGMRAPLREAISAVVLELRHLSRQREEEPAWPGCPVVVLSTTARSNVKGAESVQGMSGENPDELRLENLEVLKALPKEAGEIEATAVTAWVVALGERTTNGVRPLALRLVKSRMGVPGGWVPFEFMGATGRLREAPQRYQAAILEDAKRAADKDASKRGKTATAAPWTPRETLG